MFGQSSQHKHTHQGGTNNRQSSQRHHSRRNVPRTRVLRRESTTVPPYLLKKKEGGQPHTNKPSGDVKIGQKQRGSGSKPFAKKPRQQKFTHTKRTETTLGIPAVEAEVLRIVPLGGVEQVGQNMTAIEYGDDIIIVDAGIEFASEETPGIDYIIPNTKYLEDRREKIRGLFITHGHLDHIGAIPYVLEKIGNPPIYTRQFGAMMIAKRHEEFPHLPKLNTIIVDEKSTIRVGTHFSIDTFPISHTIPDSMGLIIKTPFGDIAFIEDVRVDNINGIPTEEEVSQYKHFKDQDILLLTMDSTSIEKPGFSLSEQTVAKNIEKIIREVTGRIIVATFASQVERIVSIIEFGEKYGKKIVIEGRSMKTNVEISRQLGLITTKSIISIDEMHDYPPQNIMMIVTGGQGEEFAALTRMANNTHKYVKLDRSDTILLSSSIIPGNEKGITKLKDNLYRSKAKIITYLDSDVHASGHGNRGELTWIHQQFKYRFFMPVHGHHYMLRQHAALALSLGTPADHIIVPDNGSIVEIYERGNKIRMRKEKAPSNISMVDGFSIGDIQEVVIRDRQTLAEDGMFIVVIVIDQKTGTLKKSPDIISRGFVYLRESQDLLHQIRGLIKRTAEDTTRGMNPINFEFVKKSVTDAISKALFQKTAKRPIVIPVVISI